MTDIKKLNDAFSTAGQITPNDLKQSAEAGFKSVLNVRSPDETGVLADEQQQAEAVGLEYANVPLSPTSADEAAINKALWELEALPKPVLVHCGLGARAGTIALIATAISNGWTLEQLTAAADKLGLKLEQPSLQHFIQKTYTNGNTSTGEG